MNPATLSSEPTSPSTSSQSLAAIVRGLRGRAPSPVFRDAACALLRLRGDRGRAEHEALTALFAEDIGGEQRLFILDLLASVGTPEAQGAMRRLLAPRVARSDERLFAAFVQRLAFVEKPEPETVGFLMSIYADSHAAPHEIRAAYAFALGAAAGRAHVSGFVDGAMRAAALLRRDLMAAQEPVQKCSLLTALGNAGIGGDVPFVLPFLGDADPRVRSAATTVLERPKTDADLVRLAEIVIEGKTAAALDARILQILVAQGPGVSSRADVVAEAIWKLLCRVEPPVSRPSGERPCVRLDAPPRTLSEAGAVALLRTMIQGGGDAVAAKEKPAQKTIEKAEPSLRSKAAMSICVGPQSAPLRRRAGTA
jgi:hypothetical protein